MRLALELFGVAFGASVFGSMVGLGGGFILVPILRLFFNLAPAEAAGTSLALVVANSGSGAFTYLLQRRVHVKLGLTIAAGGLPGSILGAFLATRISGSLFDWILALLLLAVATDMIVNRRRRVANRREAPEVATLHAMPIPLALGVGFIVGMVSSLFGVGGGVLVVPSLLYLSQLPAHAISATSHFVIALTAPFGLAAHAYQHDIRLGDVIPLVLGGLCGGPIGARLSLRLKARRLLIVVACALAVAAISLIWRDLH